MLLRTMFSNLEGRLRRPLVPNGNESYEPRRAAQAPPPFLIIHSRPYNREPSIFFTFIISSLHMPINVRLSGFRLET